MRYTARAMHQPALIRTGFALISAAALAASLNTRTDAAGVPVPAVTGPIASLAVGDASHDYPFFASIVDLKARGWVEEEFFIEGTATRYTMQGQGTATVRDSGHPYKTRILVRRPAAARAFNGTVVVEWNNVTAGRDLDIDWFQSYEHFIRSGYAWVGVTPQRVGVEALKVWNAKRYGTLDVTHAGAVQNDDLSYDAFAQAAQAIRTPGRVDVLGGLKPARIFATGHSQSAGRLANYVNGIHPIASVFDAVVVHGGGGRIRTDLTIPVFKLLAETDVLGQQAANRQPDTGKYRSWEVAGSSHVDVQFRESSSKLASRDGSPSAPPLPAATAENSRGRANAPNTPTTGRGVTTGRGLASGNAGGCERPPYSHVPFYHVMNAAFDHLVRWVKDGVPPPAAPSIETTAVGPPAVAVRDKFGNALGGIRLAEHAVPTATNTGLNTGAGFCRLYGSHEPFDQATVASLYPTHAAYVAAVRDVTERNLKAGYILKVDADQTISAAERSDVGRK
jgi:Alpha/beta hydrolase domain